MGTRRGTISARADDQGQGVEEGLFAVCFNDGEHHNQGVGLFAVCDDDGERHNHGTIRHM